MAVLVWRNLRVYEQGAVHKATGPWRTACEVEQMVEAAPTQLIKPTDDDATCRYLPYGA